MTGQVNAADNATRPLIAQNSCDQAEIPHFYSGPQALGWPIKLLDQDGFSVGWVDATIVRRLSGSWLVASGRYPSLVGVVRGDRLRAVQYRHLSTFANAFHGCFAKSWREHCEWREAGRTRICWACGRRLKIKLFDQISELGDRNGRCRPCLKYLSDLERRVRLRSRGDARSIRLSFSEGSHTDQEWTDLLGKFQNRCVCCGVAASETSLTKDHVIPVVSQGSSFISNLQPLCQSCNSRKGTKALDYRAYPFTKTPVVLSIADISGVGVRREVRLDSRRLL
jgi:5-methylcytosine-specific restriction endonuclease McrA